MLQAHVEEAWGVSLVLVVVFPRFPLHIVIHRALESAQFLPVSTFLPGCVLILRYVSRFLLLSLSPSSDD